MEKYQELKKGVVKRSQPRVVGVFIDGTGLDRAARRLHRRVDMAALVRGVSAGLPPIVCRYYTLIPYEDDSRQRAFLDAVSRAGLDVVVKRLPPKGITRQVSVDVQMAADIVAFSLGRKSFVHGENKLEEHHYQNAPEGVITGGAMPFRRQKAVTAPTPTVESAPPEDPAATMQLPEQPIAVTTGETQANATRVVTVVCPSRDLAYPIALAKEYGADTVTADFAQFNMGDVLKSAAKWIDLSDSETIWMEEK